MCGIAGFIGEDQGRIERMTHALLHRGPDGNAIYVGDGVSLGHARLAILDPRPEGNQPMWNADRTMAIVYNGEIYNYRTLANAHGLSCVTTTDTEVLLKLYEKNGTRFIAQLRGMFAFAIYDARTKTLVLARDPNGIKPLYVTQKDGDIAFASEVRSLMAGLTSKPALDLTSLSLYMRLQYVPGPRTLVEGITQLAPGTVMTWRDGAVRSEIVMPRDDITSLSVAEWKTAFPLRMQESVDAHLLSDKPVGVFLSGGMDSSIVLHHAAQSTTRMKTFTVGFEARQDEDAKRFNEDARLARMTAAHYGTDHTEVLLGAREFVSLYADTAISLDQANANPIAVAQRLLAKVAKRSVDVALTGIGGDELFGGYLRYRIVKLLEMTRCLPPAIRAALARAVRAPTDVARLSPGTDLLARLLARDAKESEGVGRGTWFDAHALPLLFEERYAMCPQKTAVGRAMTFDRTLWLVDEALRLCDGTTMGAGLEARTPFVDREIIAIAAAMPANAHVGLRRTKRLLKGTYRPMLPAHLFELKKASFFAPTAKWMRREARPLFLESLDHPRIRELFDVEALRAHERAHGEKRAYGLHLLMTITQLRFWFETVYDAPHGRT